MGEGGGNVSTMFNIAGHMKSLEHDISTLYYGFLSTPTGPCALHFSVLSPL